MLLFINRFNVAPPKFILAFLCGIGGVLAFSPFDIWGMGIVSLAGLLFVTTNQPPRKAALNSFCWGMGLFLFGVSWTYVSIQQFGGVHPVIACALIVLLAAYLSLYPLLFGYLLARLFRHRSIVIQLTIAAPALWMITEWLRGWVFSGFPWLQFGYSQIDGPLKSIAPIFGVDMISLLLVIISGCFIASVFQKKISPAIVGLILLCSPLLLTPIKWVKTDPSRQANFVLLQGNTDQALKWSASHLDTIINTYTQLTLPYLDKSPIIIWPEAAIPDTETNQQSFLSDLDQYARSNDASIILGLIDYSRLNQAIYNTVLVLGDKETYHYPTQNRYNKYYLVPFGETVPFEFLFNVVAALLSFPMSNLTPGEYIQAPLEIKGFKFITAICYEIIRGKQLRDNFTPDTDFILTVSNDTWFGRSIGPWQHFQMARMRALELGRTVIRDTNNGITAAIDTNGHVIAQIPQFQKDVLQITLSPVKGITPYVKLGALPYQGITVMMLITAFLMRNPRKKMA